MFCTIGIFFSVLQSVRKKTEWLFLGKNTSKEKDTRSSLERQKGLKLLRERKISISVSQFPPTLLE